MNQPTDSQTGERLTFFQLFSEKGYTVEIPLIQRDYAQGRVTPKEIQIRELFLTTLENQLRKGNNIDLDFVYGSLKKRDDGSATFIPLDGQQRLTTLFLLHWYLANRDGHYQELAKHLIAGNKSRFTYETRTSSMEFCNALMVNNIDFAQFVGSGTSTVNLLSEIIKDSAWYFNAWNNDPTIKSMLQMIDALHVWFGNSKGYFAKLIDDKNPIVTFQFMNLNEFSMTDDLYIKMNARGKLLTDFEIFKAWLQGYVEKHGWKFSDDNGRDWIHKLDNEWTDLFWQSRSNGRDKDVDTPFLNLFKSIGMYTVAMNMKQSFGSLTDNDATRIARFNEYKFISPVEFDTWSAFDKETLEKCFCLLDYFVKEDKQKSYLTKFITRENYSERVISYAYLLFVTEMPVSEIVSGSQNMAVWLRITGKLAKNTIIDESVEFVRAIQSLAKLWGQVKLSQGTSETWVLNAVAKLISKDIDFFKKEQCDEEVRKAELIIKDSTWEGRLRTAEDHPYFFGQIGFLLEYASSGKECNRDQFDAYVNKAAQLYGGTILNHNEHLLERALLTKGNYLTVIGANRGYCLPDSGTLRLREENWRRVFRGKDDSAMLKSLLDDLDSTKIEESLREVVRAAQGLEEWRQLIVECPEAIALCGDRRIRFAGSDEIYPLTKTTMRSYHYELRSLHLYHRYLKPQLKNLMPFTNAGYKDVTGSDELPCAYIDGWQYQNTDIRLDIEYKNKSYTLRMFTKGGKVMPTIVVDKALECAFSNRVNCLEKNVDRSVLEATILQLSTKLKDL